MIESIRGKVDQHQPFDVTDGTRMTTCGTGARLSDKKDLLYDNSIANESA
jgi:hypothetical protein